MRRLLLTFVLAGVLAAGAAPTPRIGPVAPAIPGKVFLTVEEALELAFEECDVKRERVYLTEAEAQRIEKLGNVDQDERMAFAYRARREGELVGTAYFDNHRVRTKKETVMVVVRPDETIARIELLAFGEPIDYIPRARWYAQFVDKGLDDDLELKRGVRGVTGATLTARATAGAARRSLALHRVIAERERARPR